MRQTHTLVLLSTFLSSLNGASASSSLPRGVGPEFAKFYESKDGFTCITSPEVRLSSSQLNDNSCDCPDGSDEPGTAACAGLDALSPPQPLPGSPTGNTNTTHALPGFWCTNAGHIGAYVPFAYVNDGVCDYNLCCDGTEEFGGVGGVKCENRCDEIGKEWRRVEEARKQSVLRSLQKRKSLAKEARQMRRQVESKIGTLKLAIKDLDIRKRELERRYEEVKKEESQKIVQPEGQGKLGILVGLAKKRIEELRNVIDDLIDQRDDMKDKVAQLEDILTKFKQDYNPNFNDDGVKQAVQAWEYYLVLKSQETANYLSDVHILETAKEDSDTVGVNWKEFEEEEPSDTDILFQLEAYLPDFLKDYIHEQLAALRGWLIANGILADNPKPGVESKVAQAAREAFESAQNDLSSKERALRDEEADLAQDYGPDGIFRALKNKCVSVDAGEYEYELCWMDKTTQKSKKGHGNTNMGNFVRIDREMVDEEEPADGKGLGSGERIVLRYENGQGCWNGPQRSTHVWLRCAEKEELWRVSEAEKCVYKMEVGTPAACDELVEPPQGSEKDEL